MNEPTIHPELISLRTKLTDAIDANQKQADLLLKQIEKDRELLHAINGSLGIMRAQATGYGAMTDTIRSAIRVLNTESFVADDVEKSLRTNFPTVITDKKRLRAALWNMVQRHELSVVRQGTNRAPAEYRLALPDLIRVRRRQEENGTAQLPMNGAEEVEHEAVQTSGKFQREDKPRAKGG